MAALPASSTATAASATEGDVKNFLTQLRDYLNGLLGATGVAADARAALGVTPLTAGNIATALGFSPASSSHTHDYSASFAPTTAFTGGTLYAAADLKSYARLTRHNGAYVDVGPFAEWQYGGGS